MAQKKTTTRPARGTGTRKVNDRGSAPVFQQQPPHLGQAHMQSYQHQPITTDVDMNMPNENQAPTATSGRPIRNKRGGRMAQLQETSDLISEGLARKMTGAGGKRSQQLDNVPESLPDNDMAPPTKAKRQRTNKTANLATQLTLRLPNQPEQPLRPPPVPNLNLPANIQQSVTTSANQPIPFDNRFHNNFGNMAATPIISTYTPHPSVHTGISASQIPSQTIQTSAAKHNNTSSGLHVGMTWDNYGPQVVQRSSRTYDSHDFNDDNDMAERDDANNDGSDGDGDGEGDDDGEGDGDGEDGEELGGIPINRSGLMLPENSNPLDPFDDRFYPGGEFETRQEENLGHENGQALWFGNNVPSLSTNEPDIGMIVSDRHVSQTGLPMHGAGSSIAPELPISGSAPGSFDVLEHHHEKNRPNRPPAVSHLAVAAIQQERLNNMQPDSTEHLEGTASNGNEGPISSDVEASDLETDEPVRAPRHSKLQRTARPTTAQFYPGSWGTVLERAKDRFARHTFLNQGFLTRNKGLSVAETILHEEIARGRAEKLTLDHAYEQTREMNIVVFDAATTIRGKLKFMAREIVENCYPHILEAAGFEHGNQLEEQSIIKRQVENVLQDGKFLEGGLDAEGRTNNLAHPSIEKICVSFFYTGNRCLARLFPDDFKDTIPEKAIALVMACIQNCLDEYESEGIRIKSKFEGLKYSSIYEAMVDLINDVKQVPYHCQKWEDNRKRWARKGWQRLNPAKAAGKHTLRVKLD